MSTVAKFSSSQWLQSTANGLKLHAPKGALRLADIFCGCGGLTLGAYQACYRASIEVKIALAADTSSDARSVYAKNFNVTSGGVVSTPIETMFDGGNLAKFTKMEGQLRRRVGQLDLLLAGPPCQGHSDLNNHSRRNDARNLLYLRATRAVEALKPTTAIIENVPSIIHDKYNVVETARHILQDIGYHIVTFTTSTLSVGLPQRRKRHFLVASFLGAFTVPDELVALPEKVPTLRSVISDLVDEPSKHADIFRTSSRCNPMNRRRMDYLFDNQMYDLPNSKRPICQRNDHSYKSMYGRLRWDQPAQTITSGFGCMGQGRFVHPSRRRTLTPHEAARIQGFPDFFSFSTIEGRTILQEMIGNAVPPPLAAAIVEALIAQRLLGVNGNAAEAA